MRQRLTLACLLALAVGAVLTNVGAQSNSRLFASLVSQLTTGGSTPITCTQSGSGCYLDVTVQGSPTLPGDVSIGTSLAIGTTPALTGTLRLPAVALLSSRNASNTVDVNWLSFGNVNTNEVALGNAAVAQRLRGTLLQPGGTLSDGDWWVDCTAGVNTTTGGTCSLKARTAGVTRTIATSLPF